MTIWEVLIGDAWEPERLGLYTTREKAEAALREYVVKYVNEYGGTYYGFTEIQEVEVK